MQMYVGVTDRDMFDNLKKGAYPEVNFWRPGASVFRAIRENDLFLFKLHAPDHYIVGGGYFVRFSMLPTAAAWDAFRGGNGMESLAAFNDRIARYRNKIGAEKDNPQIGCIILANTFYLEEKDWIRIPDDWSDSIVQGKRYRTDTPEGQKLYEQLKERVELLSPTQITQGGGAFCAAVTDAYDRTCAITGETALPSLKAAHIVPVDQGGLNIVNNGILMRSDLTALYENGYFTIDRNYQIHVSGRLEKDYPGSGYRELLSEKELRTIPERFIDFPEREFLDWHGMNIYLG